MIEALRRLTRRLLPRSLRGRLVATALLATLALTGTGALLVHWQLAQGLAAGLDRSLLSRAEVVAADVQANPPTEEGGTTPSTRGSIEPAQSVTAIVDPSGRVVEADPSSITDLPATLTTAVSQTTYRSLMIDGTAMRVVVVPVARTDGTWRVVVGSVSRTLDDTEDELDRVIVVAAPLLVIAVTAGSWVLAGAALRPVERMRRDASTLAQRDLRGELREPGDVAELAALARTFNELLQRLHVSLDRQEGLVIDAGHELRTPLAILSVELELADRPDRSTAALREAVSHARVEVARLNRLCADLLLLAETASDHADLAPIRMAELLAESARAHHASLAQRGAEVVIIDHDPDAVVRIRPDAMRRAIDNLITNAARFTPAGARITVMTYPRTSEPAADTIVEIQDEGPGFPAEFLPYAFERFRRADPARRRDTGEAGAGLGLAIVERIVSDHGGAVEAANRPNTGAVVRITLPVIRARAGPQPDGAAPSEIPAVEPIID